MRKANDGTDKHARALEQLGGTFDGIGLDANRRHAVFCGQPAPGFQFLVRHGRMQERVVNRLGELFVGIFHVMVVCVCKPSPGRRCRSAAVNQIKAETAA